MKVPIYFVHSEYEKWDKLANLNDIDDCFEKLIYLNGGRDCWIFQTFVQMKRQGFNVFFSQKPQKNAINIMHFDDLNTKTPFVDYFVAGVKADRDRCFLSECEIVQSPYSKETKHCFFIPHWPQHAITKRDVSRGSLIENVCYFGAPENISGFLKADNFQSELQKLGINLTFKHQTQEWSDYKNVDLVLAVRDGSEHFLNSKPASKLVNGWIAGCPVIVGNEPIFTYYKKSNLDFFHANKPREIINIIKTLRESPDLYQKMVSNGFQRANEFKLNIIADIWNKTLVEEVTPIYNSWKEKNYFFKATSLKWRLLKKKIRGSLYDKGFNEKGDKMDRTSSIRKLIWFLFDRFAYKSKQNNR